MASVTDEMKNTIAASWRQSLEGAQSRDDAAGRLHWQTKISYYQATAQVLRDAPDELTWGEVVRRAKGSRSGFYQVIGSRAAHPLLRKYQTATGGRSAAIADLYDHLPAVQQLVDETKVWSYWGYRTGWIKQLDRTRDVTRKAAAESLVQVIAGWAACQPETAGALECSPPMAGVEDMVRLWGQPGAASDAYDLVKKVIQASLGPLGTTTNGVVKSIAEQMNLRLSPPDGLPDSDRVARLAGITFDTVQWLGTLPRESRNAATRSVMGLLEDTLAELRGRE
jgi:hypothetical protein